MKEITGNFKVGKDNFSTFFNKICIQNPQLFQHKVIEANCDYFLDNLKLWSPKPTLTLGECVAVLMIVYNETGGKFIPGAEQGSKEYIETATATKQGYKYKERGRGYIQITWESAYRIVLASLNLKKYEDYTSEELDALFLKNNKVAFGSLKVFFSHPQLKKYSFEKLAQSDFKTFGTAISGGGAYVPLYVNRVNFVLDKLKNENLATTKPFYKQTWFWIGILVILVVCVYLYRKLVFAAASAVTKEITQQVKEIPKLLK